MEMFVLIRIRLKVVMKVHEWFYSHLVLQLLFVYSLDLPIVPLDVYPRDDIVPFRNGNLCSLYIWMYFHVYVYPTSSHAIAAWSCRRVCPLKDSVRRPREHPQMKFDFDVVG